MSAKPAPAEEVVAAEPVAPPKKGKKKLIIIAVAALLVLLLVGGATAVVMKKRAAAAAAAAEDDNGEAELAAAEAKHKELLKHPPTFVPLEPFVVNLADKEADRFAQIGVTLEVDDPKFAEELKNFMPAIRNGILMVMSHKTSQELLSHDGKIALAREIMREAVLPLGIIVSDEDVAATPEADAGSQPEEAAPPEEAPPPEAKANADGEPDPDAEAAPADSSPAEVVKPKKHKRLAMHNPVTHVHFSNFIVQ